MNDSASESGPVFPPERVVLSDEMLQYIQTQNPTFRIEGDRALLFAALAKAQAGFGTIVKNRTVTVQPREGRVYTFDYATLDVVLAACTPSLNANGFSFLQPFSADGDDCEVRTMLCHESGGSIELVYRFTKPDAIQKLGSVLTYVRRYSGSCLLGVSSEEDDDGNAADGNQAKASPRGERMQPDKPKPPAKPAHQHQPKAQQELKPKVDTVDEAMAKARERKAQTEREDDAMPGGPQGALPVTDDINGPDGEAVPDIDPKLPMLPQTKATVTNTMRRLFSIDGTGDDITMAMRSNVFQLATGKALSRDDPFCKSEVAGSKMIDFMYSLGAEHNIDPDGQVSKTDVHTMLKALGKRAGVQ